MPAAEEVFVMKDYDWDVSGPYQMVQPALIVLEADGAESKEIKECRWSWKTMGLADGHWDTRVDAEKGQQVMLVTLRPDMADLGAAIQERRPVRLASTHKDW